MPPRSVTLAAGLLAVMLVASPLGAANEAGSGGIAAGAERDAAASPPAAPPSETASELETDSGRFYLSPDEIERMRANVESEEWARVAWQRTQAFADAALDDTPQPADSAGDYMEKGPAPCGGSREGWNCGLYQPGLADGRKAHSLALAYAVTGDPRYANKAKEIVLAWSRRYHTPAARVGHMIAEPVGFMLKGFMAFDVTRDVFSEREQQEVREWARRFVPRGRQQADGARDSPWVPEAPYGNSATWARALAVTAAAVAGEPELSDTLAWNWEHTTSRGNDYGWSNLLEGAVAANGQMTEERLRQSIGYGLFTWYPLALIAEVARHVGFEEDLWTATAPNGASIVTPIDYYAPYLTEQRGDPYEGSPGCCYAPYPTMLRQYRAVMEIANNARPNLDALQGVLAFGGDAARGANEDPHLTGWNALAGGLSP